MTTARILAWATSVANDWAWLAVGWHVALAAVTVSLAVGWRPSQRLLASLLSLPLLSVALVAAATRNPFNGAVFAALFVLLLRGALRQSTRPVTAASSAWRAPAVALFAIGWAYPHFVNASSWAVYGYASPFGLLPCPTLLVITGMTLLFAGPASRRWTVWLFAADVLYGVIGVLVLRVSLDVCLMAGAILLALKARVDQPGGLLGPTAKSAGRRSLPTTDRSISAIPNARRTAATDTAC